jgi:transposase-like protein
VKLKVLSEDAQKAKEILRTIEKYSLDNDGNLVKCPECNSEHVQLFSTIKDLKSFLSFIFGFMIGTLPFYAKHKYRCEDCNTEFDIK